jgi:beta-glucanase (GH16 family)
VHGAALPRRLASRRLASRRLASRRLASRRLAAAAAATAVLLLLSAALTGCSSGPPPPSLRWVTEWAANFTGAAGSGLNPRDWTYDTGHGVFGNGEIETMTDSSANVHLDGHGGLAITVLGAGTQWTSGRVQTTRQFAPAAGDELMVTASIKQPDPGNALGYWPAFWMYSTGTWPEHGEIDIMEDVSGLSLHSGTLHCGTTSTTNADGTMGPCHEYTGLTSGLLPCPDCQAGYHDYSVIIDRRDPAREQIRWYLDGKQFFSVSESTVGAATWTQAVDHGFSIILDVAMGGSYPDNVCHCSAPGGATTAGGTLSVRSLAVYNGVPS